MTKFKAPWRNIPDIPERAAAEIRRNFFELEKTFAGLGGGTGFDAIIDPELTADNPSAGQFTTVKAALTFLKGGAWATNRSVVLGMKGRYTTASVTETALIASGDAPAFLRIVGIGGSWNSVQDSGVIWNSGSFTHVFTNLVLQNLTWRIAQAPSISVLATVDCRLSSTTTSSVSHGGTIGAFHSNSFLVDVGHTTGGFFHMSGGALLYQGQVSGNRVGFSGPVTFEGTSLHTTSASPAANTGYLFSGSSVGGNIVDGTDALTAGPSAGGVLTFSGTNMVIGLNVGHSDTPTALGLTIVVTGSLARCSLVGYFEKLTLPAPSGTTTQQAHFIKGYVQSNSSTAVDITGPANLDIYTAGNCTLRGSGVNGQVVCAVAGASGTAFNAIGLVDSQVKVTGLRPAASSTQKFYDLDANTKRCIFHFAGGSLFPTASTNTGATQYIVTEAGGTVVP